MGLIRLPRLGETMEEARVVAWLRAPGEAFARGDVLLEVETDKTVVEVPALAAGVMGRHLVAVGEMVALGAPIAEVDEAAGEAEVEQAAAPGHVALDPGAAPSATGAEPAAGVPSAPVAGPVIAAPESGRPRAAASPRARRLARGAGLDLDGMAGTGRGGRVTGADVMSRLAGAGPRGPGVARPDTGPVDLPGPVHLHRLDPDRPVGLAPLVLLHGLFDDGRGWRDLPGRLAAAGHPVLVADLPGHGRSAPPDSLGEGEGPVAGAPGGAIEGAARALERAIAAHLPTGPIGLVGHSLGAVLAARLARGLGNRLERLVLIAPAGLGPRIDATFLDLMAQAATPAVLARAYARLGPGAWPLSDAARAAEVARLAPRRADMAALARALARHGVQQVDIAADLEGVADRLTAIFATDDRIIDWRDAAALPPRARVHLLRGVGHLPQVVAPDLVADLIRRAARAGPGPP